VSQQEKKRIKRIKEYVVERDGSICCYCDQVLVPETITLDHIIPDSKNGMFNATNLTVACAKCNRRRGNRPFFEYCTKWKFSEEKLAKYQHLLDCNFKIQVLNIAKSKFLAFQGGVPNDLIRWACESLNIEPIDFSDYEKRYCLNISFDAVCERKDIANCFTQLIRIIELDT
jgi:hypothetical protein